jgi:hypothetical protein
MDAAQGENGSGYTVEENRMRFINPDILRLQVHKGRMHGSVLQVASID